MSAGDRQVRRSLARQGRAAQLAAARADRAYSRALARRNRLLTRARSRLPLSSAVAVGSAAVPLTLTGWTWLWFVSAGFGLRAVRSAAVLLRPPPEPQRRPTDDRLPPGSPSRGSAVYPAVCRLEEFGRAHV